MGNAALNADGGLRVELDAESGGAVLTITLDRPESRNAQLPATWRALAEVANDLGDDIRVVVIRAAGSSFSAGLDRRMFTGGVPGEQTLMDLAQCSDDEFDAVIAGFQTAFTCWRNVSPIVVAAVQGHAVGAGFQLALSADIILVADDVSFSMKETQLGLVPDLGGTGPLTEAVGYSRALDICATGRRIGADEAVASGIAVDSVPVDQLEAATAAKVAELLSAPGSALVDIKCLLRGAAARTPSEQVALERKLQRGRINELAEMFGASTSSASS